ncbi:MAG TPA: MFS transporter, partial [Acidimicrobiales bacterium]|nr:MFS transporter [Acidimicrobiales bacterium]
MAPPAADARAAVALSNRLVVLMAVATGAIVANLYYCQPLLHQMAASFHVGSAASSVVVTCTQAGYALGLLLVVPLGDLRPRRSLTALVYLIAAGFLVIAAVAPALWLFEVASASIGCASVGGQIMIPFAADLADPQRRGRIVARIMTGLLLGILLARTVSGLVAQAAGWRTVYWFSAALMVLFSLVLVRALPAEAPRPHLPYRRLVGSSVRLLATEPVLRRRAFNGAAAFGAFSVLWTSLAFLLSGPPFGYSKAVIGLFGLAGVAGVSMANLAGRMADAERTRAVTTVCAMLLSGSFGLLALGRADLVPLVAGILVLDVGTQGIQITNQAIIYRIAPEARSRVNSAYMVCYFVGGALGSLGAAGVLAASGWGGV